MSHPIIPKFKPHERIDIVYPEIRQVLVDTDDPDVAYEWLAYCIHAGMITAGKAQKMFDRRYPKDVQRFFREKVVESLTKETEGERLKREAIENRIETIKNLGLSPEEFEKQMEELVLSKAN